MAQKNVLLGDGNAREAAKEFLLAAFEGRQQFKERYEEIMNGDLPVIFGPGGEGIASSAPGDRQGVVGASPIR